VASLLKSSTMTISLFGYVWLTRDSMQASRYCSVSWAVTMMLTSGGASPGPANAPLVGFHADLLVDLSERHVAGYAAGGGYLGRRVRRTCARHGHDFCRLPALEKF
jgi:hypothetical protein